MRDWGDDERLLTTSQNSDAALHHLTNLTRLTGSEPSHD